MTEETTYKFDENPHLMIVECRENAVLSDRLLAGAKVILDKVGITSVVHAVPTILDMPSAIAYAVKALSFDAGRRRYDGYITLGCFFDNEAARRGISLDGIMAAYLRRIENVSLSNTLAIGDGVFCGGTLDKALGIADPYGDNIGGKAAEACLRMVELKHHFRLSPKKRWVAR